MRNEARVGHDIAEMMDRSAETVFANPTTRFLFTKGKRIASFVWGGG